MEVEAVVHLPHLVAPPGLPQLVRPDIRCQKRRPAALPLDGHTDTNNHQPATNSRSVRSDIRMGASGRPTKHGGRDRTNGYGRGQSVVLWPLVPVLPSGEFPTRCRAPSLFPSLTRKVLREAPFQSHA